VGPCLLAYGHVLLPLGSSCPDQLAVGVEVGDDERPIAEEKIPSNGKSVKWCFGSLCGMFRTVRRIRDRARTEH